MSPAAAGECAQCGLPLGRRPVRGRVDGVEERFCCLGCVLALLGWLVLLLTGNASVAIAAAFVVSASMAATIPMQVVFASERFAAVGAGAAIGLINTGGQLAASLGGPLYGAMLDRGLGFGAVWGTAAVLGLLRVGVVLLLRERPHPGVPRG